MESRASFSGEDQETAWIHMACEVFEALSNRPRNGGPSDLDLALSEALEHSVTVVDNLKGEGLVRGQKVPLLSISPLDVHNQFGRPMRRIFEDEAVVQGLATILGRRLNASWTLSMLSAQSALPSSERPSAATTPDPGAPRTADDLTNHSPLSLPARTGPVD